MRVSFEAYMYFMEFRYAESVAERERRGEPPPPHNREGQDLGRDYFRCMCSNHSDTMVVPRTESEMTAALSALSDCGYEPSEEERRRAYGNLNLAFERPAEAATPRAAAAASGLGLTAAFGLAAVVLVAYIRRRRRMATPASPTAPPAASSGRRTTAAPPLL